MVVDLENQDRDAHQSLLSVSIPSYRSDIHDMGIKQLRKVAETMQAERFSAVYTAVSLMKMLDVAKVCKSARECV